MIFFKFPWVFYVTHPHVHNDREKVEKLTFVFSLNFSMSGLFRIRVSSSPSPCRSVMGNILLLAALLSCVSSIGKFPSYAICKRSRARKKVLCDSHTLPCRPTVCHRARKCLRTVENGEGTRWFVIKAGNTLIGRWRLFTPGGTRRKFWACSKLWPAGTGHK